MEEKRDGLHIFKPDISAERSLISRRVAYFQFTIRRDGRDDRNFRDITL